MPPAAASRPRTYARNGPLKRARQVSSPVSAAPPSPSSPPSRTRLTSPPTILEPSLSVIVPPASPSPSTSVAMTSETSVLQPSVALGANPPAAPSFSASRGKARLHSLGGLQPLAVQGTLKGFFTALPRPTRLPVAASSSSSADRPAKRSRTSVSSSPSRSPPPFSPVGSAAATQLPAPSASLQQLLLAPLPSQLETCQTCAMTFTRTSPPDLAAHSAFHRSVERGIGWFRPDEVGPGEGVEILPGADIEWDQIGGSGKRERGTARAVRIHGIPPGKVGKKIKEVHALLNAHLSAPDLPPRVLAQTQTFLLLSASSPPTPRTTSTSAQRTFSTAAGHAGRSSMSGSSSSGAGGGGKEFVIGACVVQRIESALRVLSRDEIQRHGAAAVAVAGVDGATLGGWPEERLICVEPTSRPLDAVGSFDEVDDGVFCDPTPIPTLLGVHRIHTSALFRRLSLGSALLSVACTHAIYGVTVSTTEGGLAFSQPTRSGRRLMRSWARASGSGEVRVFVEDEE